MEMPSFTEIKAVFEVVINFLKEFFAAVEEMFGGISYGFAGYKPEEEEEVNLPE